MKTIALLLLIVVSAQAQMITQNFGTGANSFAIDFVSIGNPSNSADTTGYGSVGYSYNIGKYEISRDMINKYNDLQPIQIIMQDMSDYGGNGVNKPAAGISWNEAARFVNWLNTSKGYQAAYNFTTSGGNDNISLWASGQYSGANQFRHKDAFYFLPSADEWYKGAYGSQSGDWYKFPTGSDNVPLPVSEGTSSGTTVYGSQTGPADITNAGGSSPYATLGQGGNVWEWIESAFDGVNDSATEDRERRGGAWNDGITFTSFQESSTRLLDAATSQYNNSGLRVAMVPEPSSLSLFLAGGALLLGLRKTSKNKI